MLPCTTLVGCMMQVSQKIKAQLFDSSVGRGEFTFIIGVGPVIKGWDGRRYEDEDW